MKHTEKSEKRILIANRGEPVFRGLRTFRRLGLKVTVTSTAEDLRSPWVGAADRAITVSDYLAADEIVQKAKGHAPSGCDAIWPAWGFLSESEEFARKTEEAGLVWIGPPAAVIGKMGSKTESAAHARQAGLLTIPEEVVLPDKEGFDGVAQACKRLGFPILLKPALGGGGQGQRRVDSPGQLKAAFEEVRATNARLFQSTGQAPGPILVQRYFSDARHIETQILADSAGNVVVLGERDCSLQRRNQKVIEESPSPALTDRDREKLVSLSTALAREVSYQNAGTIEFLYADGNFYFMEMNTRLQVEHPVTEETIRVRGAPLRGERIDLVEEMVRIARGEPLRFSQQEVETVGHAIEARVYAEDPARNFLPSPGSVRLLKFPKDLRVDTAFPETTGEVSPRYDPMIAKVISWGPDRDQATRRLHGALGETVILGVATNVPFCRKLLDDAGFRRGDYTTQFIESHPEIREEVIRELAFPLAAGGAIAFHMEMEGARKRILSPEPTSLEHVTRLLGGIPKKFAIAFRNRQGTVQVRETGPDLFTVEIRGQSTRTVAFRMLPQGDQRVTFLLTNGEVKTAWFHPTRSGLDLWLGGELYNLKIRREEATEEDPHRASIAGRLVSVSAEEGDEIAPGDELFQIESMKMITAIRAISSGRVKKILKQPGEIVQAGEAILELEERKESPSPSEQLFTEGDLGNLPEDHSNDPDRLERFFLGYDIPAEEAEKEIEKIRGRAELPGRLTRLLEHHLLLKQLFTAHGHLMLFVAERGKTSLPDETRRLLNRLLAPYGLQDSSELEREPRLLVRLFQSFAEGRGKKEIVDLLRLAAEEGCADTSLAEPLAQWFREKPTLSTADRQKILELLQRVDRDLYRTIEKPPVALEYLEEFHHLVENPAGVLNPEEYRRFVEAFGEKGVLKKLEFPEITGEAGEALQRWFEEWKGREIPVPERMARSGVRLYEIGSGGSPRCEERRLLVVATVSDTRIEVTDDHSLSFPVLERSAIEAYRTLRLAQAVVPHRPNHLFLVSTDRRPVPWRTRDGEAGKVVLTPQQARKAAARIGGFAVGLQVQATEAVLPLLNDADQKVYWAVIEVRHAKPFGVISRPPLLLPERRPEVPLDREKGLNERQHQMGKLLNRDRAMLLFDNGEFEELFFPEADEETEVGLNVYRGNVCGIPTIAYAGDFRYRGGALGEREGKKLASAVVLAYLSGRACVALHDGAGANIRESVASLGWAGAYFGAIAVTGGFSDKGRFRSWFLGHHERDYFEKVLHHFGLTEPVDELLKWVPRQLVHFHLHVGATVGMLVYGASISHLSLMTDHPEAYRVLTGAQTVERVLGERGSNYSLGGARAHAEESGEIEMVFQTEEQVIDQTRRLLKLFYRSDFATEILRDPRIPRLEVPREGGLILSREGLRSHLDHGEFFETRPALKGATGILTGYAALGGMPVAVVATATDYGLSHPRAFRKVTAAVGASEDLQIPLLLLTGSQWQALSRPASEEWLFARAELALRLNRATVPKISFALGPRSLEQVVHQRMDFTIYVDRGNETPFELERRGRFSPLVARSVGEGFDLAHRALRLIRVRREEEALDPVDREPSIELPSDLSSPYPMREVIGEIFDRGSFLPFWGKDELPLITGLARLGGRTVGVIADNPEVEGGAQTVESIAKFTRFHRLCSRFGIPIVELNDSPAFRPGSEQEHGGIQGEGGKSIREEVLSEIPKVAVTLRQNYGGRLVHANLITLGPPRAGLVVRGARVGVMGAKGAVGVLYGKKLAGLPEEDRKVMEEKWLREYEKNQLDPERTVKLGYMKSPVEIKELRRELFREIGKF